MKLKWLAAAFTCMGLVYCGGGSGGGGTSGVSPNKAIGDLSDSELRDLCEYFATLTEVPERTLDCGGGMTITIGSNPDDVQADIDQCVAEAPPACQATVAEAEACFESQSTVGLSDADACALLMRETPPAACVPLMDPSCS